MRKLRQDGFTIVELTVAITVTTILLMIIMNFFANYLTQYSVDQLRGNLLAEAQTALDTISEDIRLSASADDTNRWQDQYAPNAPGNLLSWQSDGDTLVLATAATTSTNDIIFADATEYISEKNNNIFFVADEKLYKRTLASPVAGNSAVTTCPPVNASTSCPADKVLAENVKDFSIRYLSSEDLEVTSTDARSIELTLDMEATHFNKVLDASYTTRMVFRND
jgi:prepilin-type N-terminal cleavage/methylation domain-containing protein